MKINKAIVITLLFLLHVSSVADTQPQMSVNPETGGKTWEQSAHGANFLMRQILPEQLQAFYESRGFDKKVIEPYVNSCVFMTVIRNDTAEGGLHFKRDNLNITHNGKQHSLTSVDDWVKRLTKLNSKKPAVIAFRWAQFPIDQVFDTGGDWNQGMISVGLPSASKFDATVGWEIEGKPFEIKLEGVECAK